MINLKLRELAESKGFTIAEESCPILVFNEILSALEIEEIEKNYRLGIGLIPYCNEDNCENCWDMSVED